MCDLHSLGGESFRSVAQKVSPHKKGFIMRRLYTKVLFSADISLRHANFATQNANLNAKVQKQIVPPPPSNTLASARKALTFGAVIMALSLCATRSEAINALNITGTQATIGGNVDLRAIPTAQTETYFFQYSLGRTNSNIMSSGANSGYNGFMRNNSCSWNEKASSNSSISVYSMQEYAGTCSQNNTGGTVYGIENWRTGGANTWNAVNIGNGATVTIAGNLNNIVFASYRRSMQERNSLTGTDRLINLSSGTLNIQNPSATATTNIGFGTQNVWVRANSYSGGNWGSMSNTNANAASMHSMGQIIIDASGSSVVNFYTPTKIITVLDATGNEPWYNVSNTHAGNFDTYKYYNYESYHDQFNHRALRLSGNAKANILANVSTSGTIEVAGSSSLYIGSGRTLDIGKDLISSSSSTIAVHNSGGTLKVGRNFTMNGGWYRTYNGTTTATNASFNRTSFAAYTANESFTATNMTLTNTTVGNAAAVSGKIAFNVKETLNMSGSSFDANAYTLSAKTSNLTGTNNFHINVKTLATPVALGATTVQSRDSLRLLITDDINSGTAAYTAATNAKKNSNQSIKYTYGTGTSGKTLVTGTGVNNSTINLRDPTGNYDLAINRVNTQDLGLGTIRYQVTRDFTNVNGVTYYSATVTDLDTAYNPSGGGGGTDTGGGEVVPSDPSIVTPTSTGRIIIEASPILQGLIDVNFLLAQFDLMSKYQSNFNPDELVDNRKRIVKKQKEAGYDKFGRRIIKTKKKTKYTSYDYNVWGDTQYSNVTFDNGLGQDLKATMLHNKIGMDVIADFDGYYRFFVGYNHLNATNLENDNTYKGSSYEGGFQTVAELSIKKFNFKTYADIGYAYNNIDIHAENKNAETGLTTEVYDGDTKSHSVKLGVGVEKSVKLAKSFDVGAAIDLDYAFQMGKGFSVYTQGYGTTSTPDFTNHSLTPGLKLFGGYDFKKYGTYVFAQATTAYQMLGQEEYLDIDQDGRAWAKAKNAKYENMIHTAGVGVTQKIRRNFNASLAVHKIFSNAYTNNALQGRLHISYKW